MAMAASTVDFESVTRIAAPTIKRKGLRNRCGTAQKELAAPSNSSAAATFALILKPAARPTEFVNPWLNIMSSKHITALRTVTDAENLNSANGADAIASTLAQATKIIATRRFLEMLSSG